MVVSSASAGLNVASIYKQFAATSSALSGDSYQALVGGFGALFNGLGRLFWGVLSDKIGFKKSFMLLTVLQSALHFVLAKSASSKVCHQLLSLCLLFLVSSS
jgi:OFA family oxalate/formate antiporter-like MFS transporter